MELWRRGVVQPRGPVRINRGRPGSSPWLEPITLELANQEVKSLPIENIFAKQNIGNWLDINVRQKAGLELSWVSITQGNPNTQVTLTPTNLAPGKYELVLESFDNNSSVKSVLKRDTIVLTIADQAVIQQVEKEESKCLISLTQLV